MRYVKSLDGIRGVAVLLVILFHFGSFHMGWIGVQIFFTLSGYLITGILLSDRGLAFGPYVRRFYWRRALRIFPLYLAFVAAMGLGYAALGEPRSFPGEWRWLLAYGANLARLREADLGPYTVHLWSLAVEEQFYLVWPFVLYLTPLATFKRIVAGVLLLSPLVRLALYLALTGTGHDPEYAGKALYVLPFTQFDAFATGAAIPLWGLERLRRAGTWLAAALGVAAAAGIASLAVDHLWRGGADVWALGYPMYLRGSWQYAWGYTVINVASALGIVWTLQRLPGSGFLEAAPLVRIGKVSYGVYVYHLPLLVLAEAAGRRIGLEPVGAARPIFFLAYLAVVLVVSEASFRLLEAPFLRLKDLWAERARAHAAEDPSA